MEGADGAACDACVRSCARPREVGQGGTQQGSLRRACICTDVRGSRLDSRAVLVMDAPCTACGRTVYRVWTHRVAHRRQRWRMLPRAVVSGRWTVTTLLTAARRAHDGGAASAAEERARGNYTGEHSARPARRARHCVNVRARASSLGRTRRTRSASDCIPICAGVVCGAEERQTMLQLRWRVYRLPQKR